MRKKTMQSDRKYKWIKLGHIAFLIMLTASWLLLSGCGRNIEIKTNTFTESSQELDNPGRGFYYIYGFQITDKKKDYQQIVADKYEKDQDTRLALVQINLQNYRSRAITKAGLANIEALLCALEDTDKELILRFVYDWNGDNKEYEPGSLDTILTHMEQVGPALRRHYKQIFTLQGLFIGNWGEMNGTKFLEDEDLSRLASKLADVTDKSTYLSVRTPVQWRKITRNGRTSEGKTSAKKMKVRLGLFNDGMLGNETDYGTYGTGDGESPDDRYFSWQREDELAFQDDLCRRVPNGGEVINANPFNDFDRAVEDLAAMHVTYLNQDYDREVLEKWAAEKVSEQGCFFGMDGLNYIKRHLGYRLLIANANLQHMYFKNALSVDVTFKNVGFAPLYRNAKVQLSLYNEEKDERLTYKVPQNLRKLTGGKQAQDTLTLHKEIPLKELSKTNYKLYVSITDSQTGKTIFLANEQEAEKYGYCIGTVDIE